MLSLTFLFVLMLICILFSIVVTSLGEERAGLYVSLAFVCLSCVTFCVSFSLPLGVGCRLRSLIVDALRFVRS